MNYKKGDKVIHTDKDRPVYCEVGEVIEFDKVSTEKLYDTFYTVDFPSAKGYTANERLLVPYSKEALLRLTLDNYSGQAHEQ